MGDRIEPESVIGLSQNMHSTCISFIDISGVLRKVRAVAKQALLGVKISRYFSHLQRIESLGSIRVEHHQSQIGTEPRLQRVPGDTQQTRG